MNILKEVKIKGLREIKIGFSEIPLQNLVALSQVRGLQRIYVNECIISYSYQSLKDIEPNPSLRDFVFYKNQLLGNGV